MAIEIKKDSQIVSVLTAAARKERLDSNVVEEADKLIKDLASNPNPHNKYQIAQLVGFAVNELQKRDTNWVDQIADTKRVGFGDKAQFQVKLPGVRAFIQAKGATTPRSKNAQKTFSMETIAVSCRPFINRVELQNGLANAADLINDANYQMTVAMNRYFESVLIGALNTGKFVNPYYGAGTGAIVQATFDPMLYHWIRTTGGAAIMGDIENIAKLSALTGFDGGNNTKVFAEDLIKEHNDNAALATYKSAKVVELINPFMEDGTDDVVFKKNYLYILPAGIDASMRPLKVVFEGDVFSEEATNIDDLTWEIRLDQYFNAAVAYGDRPYMGVYEIK